MRDPLPFLTALLTIAVIALAYAAERLSLAIYALSFWHYLVYALAFLWRQISHERFKRDSLLLKTISLAALALVFVTTLPNVISAIVMAAGFALNIAATRALGTDRTYYGFELAAMPPERITGFPYSMTAHPMLIGNMLAFGGTLLDPEFLRDWWPLGVLHVLLNLSIILMEAYGSENRRHGLLAALGGLAVGAALLLFAFASVWPYALLTVVACLIFGGLITRRYA